MVIWNAFLFCALCRDMLLYVTHIPIRFLFIYTFPDSDNLPYTEYPPPIPPSLSSPLIALHQDRKHASCSPPKIQHFEFAKGAHLLILFRHSPLNRYFDRNRGQVVWDSCIPPTPSTVIFFSFIFLFPFYCLPVLSRSLIAELPRNEVAKRLLGFALMKVMSFTKQRRGLRSGPFGS